MTNHVVLSGKIEKVYDLGEFTLASIRVFDELFYLFFDSLEYDYKTLEKCYVCAKGYLQHIRYKLETNVTRTTILAVCVEEMEKCDI